MSEKRVLITAAFPYPTETFNLTRWRLYTIADVYARYMKMKGYNVLYPMGFHYTGTPIIAMSEKVKQAKEALKKFNLTYEDLKSMWEEAKKRGKELGSSIKEVIRERGLSEYEDALEQLLYFLFLFELPMEDVLKLDDPLAMANYFAKITEESMKRLGYMIDWRRKFTTVDEHFKQFIRWQYLKLKEMGYISKGTHPVAWDPVYQTPVSQHDTKGDVEPEIRKYYAILMRYADKHIPAILPRPELIFGISNIWFYPSEYVEVMLGDKRFILEKRAAERLKHQLNMYIIRETKLPSYVKDFISNEYPLIENPSLNPHRGTGFVVSTPSHNPLDYVEASKRGIKGREVIEPRFKFEDKLEGDLIKLYRKVVAFERKKGKIKDEAVSDFFAKSNRILISIARIAFSGENVEKAQEKVIKMLRDLGEIIEIYDIRNAPIISKFGNEVVVKLIDTYMFKIDKNKASMVSKELKVAPFKYSEELKRRFENLDDHIIVRPIGLGTPLPWDPNWVIESLSDSTIYMAFYTVAPHVKKVDAEKLKPEVWDYILLGKGNAEEVAKKYGIDVEILKKAREEFEYWYKNHLRFVHKGLLNLHVPLSIYTHFIIGLEVPKTIFVTGNVDGNLNQILKLEPDVARALLIFLSEPWNDAKIDDSMVNALTRLYNKLKSILNIDTNPSPPQSVLDKWFVSKASRIFSEAEKAIREFKVRDAFIRLTFDMISHIEKYRKIGGNESVIAFVNNYWRKLLSIFMPFIGTEGTWKVPEKYILEEAVGEYVTKALELGADCVTFHVADDDSFKSFKDVIEAFDEGALWMPTKEILHYFKLPTVFREAISKGISEAEVAKKAAEILQAYKVKVDVIKEEALPFRVKVKPCR